MIHLLLTLCLLTLPLMASAAPQFAVEVGGSQIWIGYEDEFDGSDPAATFGFNAAATAQFDLAGSWGLSAGLRYSQLGDEIKYEDVRSPSDPSAESGPATTTTQYQYLGVPVVIRWSMPGDTAPFLFGGTELAYLLKYTTEFEFDDGTGSTGKREFTDSLNRFNMTAIVGAGVAIGMGEHKLDASIRYAHGLIDTTKLDQWFPRRTREFAVTLGFRF
ncbi:hypothetical protein DRQ53_06845 [bacterium]|nr:MAG: hypothetical protein DRQ53_06845 [bacterium]